jgi:hypothetical protein
MGLNRKSLVVEGAFLYFFFLFFILYFSVINSGVAPQILIVLFLIYLFDNIIQLISLRNLWYYGGW